ncbi:MAG: nucleotide exchange factor GrpE [Candidatus Obscuribacterales bacterium]|nr:nucleotide exchange factor GrpE [Candidatus Obscuribacterales bacterium]
MPDDDEKNQASEGEEKGSRMDAAKAFFRAMYAGDEPQPEAAPSSQADSRRVKELEQQVKEFEQKASDAENLYKRMAADFDNFRRRMEREREEFTNAGVRKAAEAIIPALDDLDRAMLYLTPETPADKVIESFQLVASRINQCLEQAGLKRLNTKGVLFDPRFHEPVQQIETSEHADGTIVHELRGGYTLGERVIRPALVNVALNNSVTIETVGELKEESQAQAEAAPAAVASEVKSADTEAKAEEPKVKAASSVKIEATDDGVYDLGNLDDF